MDNIKLYAQFTKKDEDQRLVEGYASSEALDSQGEIIRIEAIERALPDYMKFANIREMHQFSAVGKTISATIDKAKKGLYIVCKVIDPVAWEKVKEGVYNGFSIGGRVLQRIDNVIEDLRLSEISLVDRPANPEAVFTMYKCEDCEMGTEDGQMPRKPHEEIMLGGYVLDLARDLRQLLSMFEAQGRSTTQLAGALNSLKTLAVGILTDEEKKKFEKILYAIDFKEIDPTKIVKGEKPDDPDFDLRKHIDSSWQAGYFENLRKVLG